MAGHKEQAEQLERRLAALREVDDLGYRRRAKEFVEELISAADENEAPCLRDDLEDNRDWLEPLIATFIEEVADGRKLYTTP